MAPLGASILLPALSRPSAWRGAATSQGRAAGAAGRPPHPEPGGRERTVGVGRLLGPEAVPSRSNYAVRRTRTGEQLLRDRQPDARGGDRGPARRTALGSALTPACPNGEWQTDGRGQQRFKAAAAAPSKGFLHHAPPSLTPSREAWTPPGQTRRAGQPALAPVLWGPPGARPRRSAPHTSSAKSRSRSGKWGVTPPFHRGAN